MAKESYYGSPRISTGFPECPLPITFDTYKYCSFHCLYCLSDYNKCSNPSSKDIFKEGKVNSVNPEKVIKLFTGQYPNNPIYKFWIKKKKVIQWGGLAEPFDYFEENRGIGYQLMKFFAEIEYPIRFCAKGTLLLKGKYRQLLEDNAEKLKDKWFFLYTIITTDEEMSKKLERGTPSPAERYKTLAFLKSLGYKTGHRLRPFIIGISDKTLDDMLKKDLEVDIDALCSEIYCVDVRATGLSREAYKQISKLVGYDVETYYKKCSVGNLGLLRLTPKIKEPYFLKMYEWCKKYGKIFASNDPHFKHLNTTYCCCGLPDDGSPLSNFSKFTTTSVIKYLHDKYMAGEKPTITWTEFVEKFGSDNIDFLKAICIENPFFVDGYLNKHKLINLNLFDYLHNLWNTPKSKARGSLYYYYGGRIKPIGLDKKGDVIYQYFPK